MISLFRTYLLYCLLLLGTVHNAAAQEPFLENFTSKNGLPSNLCFFVLQDREGFIWIATDAGVSRYDGVKFENFSVDAGLSDNQVLKIYEDKKGRIWFITLNGRLSYFYKGIIYNSNNDPLVKSLSQSAVVTSFLEDKNGRIWLGTNSNYISMWDGKELKKYSSTLNNRQFHNAFIHQDNSGTIRAYTANSVFVFNDNAFRVEDYQELPLSPKTFNSTSDGKILYLKADGLYQKSGALALIKQKIDPVFLSNSPGYFYSDEKEIWLSTANGVVVLQPNSAYTVYLSGQMVNQVMKDRDGNFWFSTPNGIFLLPTPAERLYTVSVADGLSNNSVFSIQKDLRNRIWLGLDKGVIDVLNSDKTFSRSLRIPSINKHIKQLKYIGSSDALYFTTDVNFGRLNAIAQSKPSLSLLKEYNNAQFAIKNFDVDSRGATAMALSSGVIRLEPDLFTLNIRTLPKEKFILNRAYRVYFDQKDNLWFSNIQGLNGYWKQQLHTFYANDKRLTERINDIINVGNNTMALATDGYGIIFIQNQKIIKTLTVADGLSSNITSKLFVHKGFLWAITNFGVHKINLENNSFDIKTLNYATELFANGINDLFVDNEYAYFGTNNGLVYLPNSDVKTDPKKIKVLITKIELDNIPTSIQEKQLSIPIQYNTLMVQFSVVNFSNRNIRYRYRLKENTDWIAATGNRLEFSALEPGDYNLEIAAQYPGEKWSTSTELKFKIERKFFQSTWFWVFVSLLFALIVFRVYVVLNRRQRDKEKLKFAMQNKILTLEQQALQALMNPHFIFNVMNAIQHYINTQEKNAANKMLTGFARLIRKNLDICSKSYISIEEELEYLQLYLSLEKLRFGEKFEYSIKLDKGIETSEILIPSMLLQPFIENAIWHGLMPRPDLGKVDIHIQLVDDALIIEIKDNGIGLTASKALKDENHISKGMDLTRERIKLINSIEQNLIQLDVAERPNGGTIVRITIPI